MESEDGECKREAFGAGGLRLLIEGVPRNHTLLSFGKEGLFFSTLTILSNAGLKQHCKVSLASSTYTFNFDLFH